MTEWWNALTSLNRVFYVIAIFFSTLFAWQFFSAFSGLGDHDASGADAGGHDGIGGDVGGHDGIDVGHADGYGGDSGPMVDAHGEPIDADDSGGLVTFRLLSIRSVLAFGTLFGWAGALYLNNTRSAVLALIRAGLWGIAGMLVVAAFFWMLPRLTEEGTTTLDSAVGKTGTVYINIPEDGAGQIRVNIRNSIQYVRARARYGAAIPAGTMVRIARQLDSLTVEVEELEV